MSVLQELDKKINSENVLFFDMDGTLVDTNYANFLLYTRAIQQLIQSNIDFTYDPNERFTREVLKKVIPNLSEPDFKKIIQLKNKLYIEHLPETKLNDLVAKILKKFSKTNETILITNCRKERALITLEYYGLADKFSHKLYRLKTNSKKNNKYEYALISLQIPSTSVVVFENEKSEINTAILAGIPDENIISI